MKKTYCAGLLAIMLLASCAGSNEGIVDEFTYDGNTVTISDNSPILSKLYCETISKELYSIEFRTVGTAQAPNGKIAEVHVPFDGRVISCRVHLGDRVRAGETLFEMSSPEFLETSKLYFQSLKNYDKAKADYERKLSLQEVGIVSQRELQEAYTEAENALQEKESAEAAIRVYGMNPASMASGQAQKIIAPISGEVVVENVTPGAFTKADGDPLITVADLSKIWVTAQVKERFVGQVSKGSNAEVFTEANPDEAIAGKVIYVGNLVDEQTRSVEVIVECDNPGTKLKHGMYVSVHFLSEPQESILIPSTAVFQGEDQSYVFVATDKENVFTKRIVSVGQANDDKSKVLIVNGLSEGETILAEGGLYIIG